MSSSKNIQISEDKILFSFILFANGLSSEITNYKKNSDQSRKDEISKIIFSQLKQIKNFQKKYENLLSQNAKLYIKNNIQVLQGSIFPHNYKKKQKELIEKQK